MITRRGFLIGAGAAPLLAAAEPPQSLLLIREAEARRLRDSLPPERAAFFERYVERSLNAGPWSVTFHRPTGLNVNAGPNDYVSEGPYWWPDPKDAKAPYIRKDGQRNPGRFNSHRTDLGNLCTAALSLGLGAFFLKKEACAVQAAKVLAVWFIDPRTRMNPNLEHGQMVRGVNEGRGTGIIDTASFIQLIQGVMLLEAAGGFSPVVAAGVRQWFEDYLKWMNTSRKGMDEKVSGNNHATWWTAQAAAFAAFTGNAVMRRMAWAHYTNYLVPTEIQPDGSCPREEERTNSLGYSSMNLDAFSLICRLAQMDGLDLWHYRTSKGIALETCFSYLTPYVLHPETWKKMQIGPYNSSGTIFPALAAAGLNSAEYRAAWKSLPHGDSPWVQFVDMATASAA